MSKKDTAIKTIINHFLTSKEPLYIHAYSWKYFDEQEAVRWLSNKKFLKSNKEGDKYKITRSKIFYNIYEDIKNMNAKDVIHYLKEVSK